MSNDTDRKCRKAAVLKYYEDGVPIKNIAEEFNIEIDTVRTYIRESKQDEGLFGAAGYATGEPKWNIERWGRDMIGREVKTPSGKMTIVEAYPHILRLYARSIGYQTYTTAEIYYMNRGTR